MFKPVIGNIKNGIGHCLLGASAVETVFTIKSMKEGIVPYIPNLERPLTKTLNFAMKEDKH